MADQKTSTSTAAQSAPKAGLAPAGESGDPEVHRLLAEIQTARLNGENKQVDDLRKQLADLGYE